MSDMMFNDRAYHLKAKTKDGEIEGAVKGFYNPKKQEMFYAMLHADHEGKPMVSTVTIDSLEGLPEYPQVSADRLRLLEAVAEAAEKLDANEICQDIYWSGTAPKCWNYLQSALTALREGGKV